MFDNPYDFKGKGHTKKIHSNTSVKIPYNRYTYAFKDDDKQTYLVYLDQYDPNIFIVKYHLKNHSSSSKKYSLRTNGNHAARVICTSVYIMIDMLKKNPYASFGFIGAADNGENKVNTKRFRIYSKVMARLFAPTNFTHYHLVNQSAYFMLSKNTSDQQDVLDALDLIFRELLSYNIKGDN